MGLTHRLVAVLIVYLSGAIDSEHILLLEDLAGTLKPIRGPTIRTVVIASPDTILPEMIGLPTLRDSKRTFVQNYAASTGAGYLIRPDSYIGYHAGPLTEASLLEYLREASLLPN